MRTFILALALLILGYLFLSNRPVAPVTASEPTVIVVTATPTPADPLAITTPTATPAGPIEHGQPQRMQFAVGTYGGTYAAGTWTLWARQGQTLTLTGADLVNARLTAPNGDAVTLVGNKATLPANGDYTLTVAGLDQFGIDIR